MSDVSRIGSVSWREHVFSTPSLKVRNEKARSSVRSVPKFDGLTNRIDGGNVLVAAYVLNYFKRIGAIRRWKLLPFEWLLPTAEKPSVPKFVLELAVDRMLVVVQTHDAKYLTQAVQGRYEEERSVAQQADMSHVVWTDAGPLTPAVRSLHFMIRRARHAEQTDELNRLVAFTATAGTATISDLVAAGHDPSLVPVGVHCAQLFVPMEQRLTGSTPVSTSQQTDARAYLLKRGFEPNRWWDSLDRG